MNSIVLPTTSSHDLKAHTASTLTMYLQQGGVAEPHRVASSVVCVSAQASQSCCRLGAITVRNETVAYIVQFQCNLVCCSEVHRSPKLATHLAHHVCLQGRDGLVVLESDFTGPLHIMYSKFAANVAGRHGAALYLHEDIASGSDSGIWAYVSDLYFKL